MNNFKKKKQLQFKYVERARIIRLPSSKKRANTGLVSLKPSYSICRERQRDKREKVEQGQKWKKHRMKHRKRRSHPLRGLGV